MNSLFHIDSFAATHPGRVRPDNEDRFLARPETGLWLAADGVGGLAHGEIASSMIVEAAQKSVFSGDHLTRLKQLGAVFGEANQKIQALALERGAGLMASTVVALLATEDAYTVAWCGDSRVYLIREGQTRQLTVDHTEVQDLLDKQLITEDEAAQWPRRNAVIHVIGVKAQPVVEMMGDALQVNDSFLLCTDGLSNYVKLEEISAFFDNCDAETACRKLIHCALERGGRDNITAVAVRFLTQPFQECDPQQPSRGKA